MMRRFGLIVLVTCLALVTWQLVMAQEQKAEPKVTIDVAAQPAADVAAEITKQASAQTGVVSPCTATATVKVADAKTEEAVKAFAEAIEASWIRAYILESAPPPTPFTADQLFGGISNQHQNWDQSLTDEQRAALTQQWRVGFGRFGGGRGGPGGPGGQPQADQAPVGPQVGNLTVPVAIKPEEGQPPVQYPGAGRSGMMRRLMQEARQAQENQQGQGGAPPAAGAPAAAGAPPAAGAPDGGAAPAPAGAQPGQPGQPGQGGQGGQGGGRGGMNFGAWDDSVAGLIIPVRTENVTVKLDNVPLQQALFDLTTASGFVVAAGADLSGNITLQAENKPINEVLDEIAKAVNAQWRPIYLLSVPRQLSEQEQEARQEQRELSRWARYWAMPAEQRAQEMQQRIEGINRWAEMAKQGDERGQRAARALQRFGPRMAGRLARYSAGLTPEQRNEIRPLIRAINAAAGGQQ